MYNPMGLYENFRPTMGVIHQGGGVIQKKFIVHFYAQNAVPGLYEGRNGRSQKIFIFFAAKNGGSTPGGYTSGITVTNQQGVTF